jgi:hypothetical protein
VLRDSDPGMASASMGSVSLSSDFLFLPPFLCLPGELRALALLGAPLLPLPSGAPLLPRHRGATGGRHFPPSLFGRGVDGALSITPPGEAPVGPGEVQEHHPPHPGGLGAAPPAFVGAPNSSLRAYRGLLPGDRDPIAVARSREVVRIADLGREEKELPFNIVMICSL